MEAKHVVTQSEYAPSVGLNKELGSGIEKPEITVRHVRISFRSTLTGGWLRHAPDELATFEAFALWD